MHIGIAVTTRNRPYTFKLFCDHLARYVPHHECEIVIVDDNSTPDNARKNARAAQALESLGAKLIYSTTRLGVARAKNTALAPIRHCDHIFLLEDDCWPIRSYWDKWLIHLAEINGCQQLNACHPNGFADEHIVGIFGATNHTLLVEVANPSAPLMYFTGHALATLGGFDARMGICGGEDTQMLLRAHRAGFKPAPYCGPADIGDWFYSVDFDHVWGKEKRLPPIGSVELLEGSCLTGQEKSEGWSDGAKYVHDADIYKEPEV